MGAATFHFLAQLRLITFSTTPVEVPVQRDLGSQSILLLVRIRQIYSFVTQGTKMVVFASARAESESGIGARALHSACLKDIQSDLTLSTARSTSIIVQLLFSHLFGAFVKL